MRYFFCFPLWTDEETSGSRLSHSRPGCLDQGEFFGIRSQIHLSVSLDIFGHFIQEGGDVRIAICCFVRGFYEANQTSSACKLIITPSVETVTPPKGEAANRFLTSAHYLNFNYKRITT